MSDFDQVRELDSQYHFQMYGRYPIALTRGKGTRVWDSVGKEYLDMLAGIAVNSLGHCHPRVVEAIQIQAGKLIHCTNLYHTEVQAKLARLLVDLSDLDRVFFCNSGTEAIEGAIKLARKWGSQNDRGGEIISMEGSFHGRTLGALSATGQAALKKGLDPLPHGFTSVPFNDLGALRDAVGDQTIAILLEPIQGEGGVIPADPEYLKSVKRLCDEKKILLIFDEIQTGLCRTGSFFAYQNYGVVPDIMALAKALGGGFPIGALLAKEEISKAFAPGDHGTTFGGNPIACAAAYAAVTTMVEENLADRSHEMGDYLRRAIRERLDGHASVREIRGKGLMVGVVLDREGKDVVMAMMHKGLLGNCTAGKVIRFVPPLNISKTDLDSAVAIFAEALEEVCSR